MAGRPGDGFRVHHLRSGEIDSDPPNGFGYLPRDRAMFESIKREIFDVRGDARVIVYVGAFHVAEHETETGIFLAAGKKKPLGVFLDQYTQGKNFSV